MAAWLPPGKVGQRTDGETTGRNNRKCRADRPAGADRGRNCFRNYHRRALSLIWRAFKPETDGRLTNFDSFHCASGRSFGPRSLVRNPGRFLGGVGYGNYFLALNSNSSRLSLFVLITINRGHN